MNTFRMETGRKPFNRTVLYGFRIAVDIKWNLVKEKLFGIIGHVGLPAVHFCLSSAAELWSAAVAPKHQ